MPTEASLQRHCAAWLRSRGAFCEVRSPSPFTANGVADITGCYKGFFFAIEWKAPGKRNTVTALQEKYIQKVRVSGGYAFVVDSWDEFLEVWNILEKDIERWSHPMRPRFSDQHGAGTPAP